MILEWTEEVSKKESALNEVLSFEQYMEIFEKNPEKETRGGHIYFLDMFRYFRDQKEGAWNEHSAQKNLFRLAHPDSPAVYGQEKVLDEIIMNLKNFVEEGFNNKFLLLVGPNGSSKSSIIRKIMTGAEEYSKTQEGALYSFSWIFPIENYVKGGLGLGNTNPGHHNLKTYAFLEDKDISAILTSELKDHPLLLIPIEYRQKILDNAFEKKPKLIEELKKTYLYNGDVSKKNRMIYDALLRSYKGSHLEVLKHIRIERFTISKRYSQSAVTIEPQLHLDARLQQITMDRRLAGLPPSLQSLNLFSMHGEVVMANRGILEFSDLLKRPLDTFKYLLMTMETKNINLQGILTELDIFFVGTSNEIHLSAFKQHPDYNSFRGRFNFLRVPYLLNYDEEQKIYKEQVENLSDRTHFEPHAIEVLCQFAVMTRLRPCLEKNYGDKTLGRVSAGLSPLEKAMFFAYEILPERLTMEEKQILKLSYWDIASEFENDNLYEGKFGISPRTIKQIIYEIAAQHEQVTFIEVLDYLNRFIERRNEHDFLNIAPQGEFHNPPRFIDILKHNALGVFEDELRDCLGLVDQRSYESYLGRYIQQIMANIKNDKIKNNVTGKFEESDMYFIKEFESNLKIQEKPEIFRSHLLSQLGAYSLDNPGKPIVYTAVFPNLVKKLQLSFREEQKKKIQKISTNLIFFIQERGSQTVADSEVDQTDRRSVALTREGKEEITGILNELQKKYHYSEKGALGLIQFLIKGRY